MDWKTFTNIQTNKDFYSDYTKSLCQSMRERMAIIKKTRNKCCHGNGTKGLVHCGWSVHWLVPMENSMEGGSSK